MSDRDAFLAQIRANPQCEATRKVFADWLDENGEPEWAEEFRGWEPGGDLDIVGEDVDAEKWAYYQHLAVGCGRLTIDRCRFTATGPIDLSVVGSAEVMNNTFDRCGVVSLSSGGSVEGNYFRTDAILKTADHDRLEPRNTVEFDYEEEEWISEPVYSESESHS